MKEHGTFLVPTLMAGEAVFTRAKSGQLPDYSVAKGLAVWPMMQQSFRKAHEAGVKIAFGTDTGVTPHGENAHEFELLVANGMRPMEAILAATRSAAMLLGRDKEIGTVEPGYSVPTVEPWSTRFELVPTVAVPLPEPLAEKYAQPPIAARAATSTTARTAIVFVVTNFM